MKDNYFSKKLEALGAKTKRILALSITAIVVGLLLLFVVKEDESTEDENNNQTVQKEENNRILLDKDNQRDIGIDNLAAEVRLLNQEKLTLRRQFEDLKKNVEEAQVYRQNEIQRQFENYDNKLKQKNTHETSENIQEKTNAIKSVKKIDYDKYFNKDDDSLLNKGTLTESDIFTPRHLRNENNKASLLQQNLNNGQTAGEQSLNQTTDNQLQKQTPSMSIVSYAGVKMEGNEDEIFEKNKNNELKTISYIPSGSIISGVILNGLDAPTSQGAKRDPFPILIRIQKEAILPNYRNSDVRECFILASGYGDLGTERVYLRSENISCIRDDDSMIEAEFSGYVVGEDGKAGIKGRVVSKQGSLIAKSMMAGFLSGLGETFSTTAIPVISVGGSATTENISNSEALKTAAYRGVGKAMDRIAKFYLDMAESIFPVIEISGGREIDLIATAGTALKAKTQSINKNIMAKK